VAAQKAGKTLAQFKEQVDNAVDIDSAQVFLDEARSVLDGMDNDALAEHYRSRWGQ
jgi:hypothetical protein